jgi:hypothetical protein
MTDDEAQVTIQVSDLTLIIIYTYNLIAFGIIVKWLLPEIRKWRQAT